MTKSEQHNLIQRLKDCSSKMNKKDLSDLEMMAKRDRDDEDLDVLSVRRLEELHDRYVPKRTKADIDALFKKYVSDEKKPGKGEK